MPKVDIKPLSVNKCWQGRRFKSLDYKAYEEELLLLLPKRFKVPDGELQICVTAGFSNRGSDLDNIFKPLVDILQKKYDFNDSRIYSIIATKQIVPKGQEFICFEIDALI